MRLRETTALMSVRDVGRALPRGAAPGSLVLAIMMAGPAIAQDTRWDELANAPFPGSYPTEETRARLLDELYFQRAVQVYVSGLP
jgi:hypothetical protein